MIDAAWLNFCFEAALGDFAAVIVVFVGAALLLAVGEAAEILGGLKLSPAPAFAAAGAAFAGLYSLFAAFASLASCFSF